MPWPERSPASGACCWSRYNGLISPGSVGTSWLINILIIAVIGGLRHPVGSFIGAIVFVLLQNFAIDLIDRERFNLVIGLGFLVIVLFSPDGLLGVVGQGEGMGVAASWRSAQRGTKQRVAFGRCSTGAAGRPPIATRRKPMTKRTAKLFGALTEAAIATVLAAAAQAQETVKIGLLATLEGPFAAGGQDGMRGAELAVKERGGTVAGKKIELVKASSDAKPDVAVNSTRKLVEQDKVQIMVGPLSGSEGIAVKEYSKSQPGVTFINGGSGAQATTLVNPSPNFFRFNTDGGQWMVGLGDYAYNTKKFKKMALVAEDYAFPYSQVQGFMAEFCKAGGKVTSQGLGPAGRQGLFLGHRQAAPGCRRAAGGTGRLRCRELPQPVRAGRRRQANGRRLDHGRPDRTQLQGSGASRCSAPRRQARWPTASIRPNGRSSSSTTRRTSRTAFRARRFSPSSTTST